MSKIQTKWIADGAVDDSKIKLRNNQNLKARNAADNADISILKVNASDEIEFASNPKVGSSLVLTAADKGVSNGVATLDGSGKIPSSQLTVNAMEYKGTWNASTNSPSLADGTGNTGDFYKVATAGSQDLGSGSITFAIGDWVLYNGATWEKTDHTESVSSVNGYNGAVVLGTDDISEGSTNLYFTNARAKSAAVSDTVYGVGWDGVTDVAPSKNAVYDKIESLGASLIQAGNEIFTLSGTNITNGYVELAQNAKTGSVQVVAGGLVHELTADYTLSIPVAVTRVTFAGDLSANLIAGDKLLIQYMY
jgi:hypothetical protein